MIVALLIAFLPAPIQFELDGRYQRASNDVRKLNVSCVDLFEADLHQCTRMIGAQTGVTITVESSNQPYGHVTLALHDRPLEEVLHRICRSGGASLRFEHRTFVVGPP